MFRKYLIFAMFATATGYCFADDGMARGMGPGKYIPQETTSEVFEIENEYVDAEESRFQDAYSRRSEKHVKKEIPAWPLAGSDADVSVNCDGAARNINQNAKADNVRIVSKIGDDMVVENNFEFSGDGWSGGANMLHGKRIPVGFDDECDSGAEMPLLRREMLEDDGGEVLAVSRSGRKNCTKRNKIQEVISWETTDTESVSDTEFAVEDNSAKPQPDQVRSWVVASGQTLREVLQDWCDKEGWDLVWSTSREYPIEASAVFKGRFTDVASALVRNFGRATPVPYAKFYKGNLVLVISTNEE